MKKKKYNLFKIVFCMFLFIYLVLFFSSYTGYYEYNNYKKTRLTNEQIEKFENDIKEGKELDLNEYLVVNKHSYKTSLSNLTIRISESISGIVSKCVKVTFKKISKFVDE